MEWRKNTKINLTKPITIGLHQTESINQKNIKRKGLKKQSTDRGGDTSPQGNKTREKGMILNICNFPSQIHPGKLKIRNSNNKKSE